MADLITIKIRTVHDSVTGMLNSLSMAFSPSGMLRIHQALGQEFLDMTKENFLYASQRPSDWPALSPKYAAKVHRTEATLYESGNLFNSFTLKSDAASATIENDATSKSGGKYAAAHQYGYAPHNLPARPFAPIIGDQLTPYALNRMERRAQAVIESMIGPH